MYAIRVKPQHPIGIRHRAGTGFSRDWTFLEEVPEEVHADEWLEVRGATEEEIERLTPKEEPGGTDGENPQGSEGDEFAKWVTETSVKDIMAWVEEAEELGNREGIEKILTVEQARGDDARKTLIQQLEEKLTAPSGENDGENPQGS